MWLAASTREGEEPYVLDAFDSLGADVPGLASPPGASAIRNASTKVAAMIDERKLAFCRRSEGGFPSPETRCPLGDSMGEMPAYFAAADIALIGGNLLPFGGQNLIEAAACGCPVIVGPHTYNFAQATEDALVGAAKRALRTPPMLPKPYGDCWKTQKERQECATPLLFRPAQRGATARTMALIKEFTGLRTTVDALQIGSLLSAPTEAFNLSCASSVSKRALARSRVVTWTCCSALSTSMLMRTPTS